MLSSSPLPFSTTIIDTNTYHLKKKRRRNNSNNNNKSNRKGARRKCSTVVGGGGVLFGNNKIRRLREPKKQKINQITITITINERIECSGCRCDIYPAVYQDNVDNDMCEGFCSFTMVTAKSATEKRVGRERRRSIPYFEKVQIESLVLKIPLVGVRITSM